MKIDDRYITDARERMRKKAQNEATYIALNNMLKDAQNQIERLREENERLRKDAERYQWLRAKARTEEGAPDGPYIGVDSEKFVGRWALFGSAADAAIDAARGAK